MIQLFGGDDAALTAAKKYPPKRDSHEQGLVDEAIAAGRQDVKNADFEARRLYKIYG